MMDIQQIDYLKMLAESRLKGVLKMAIKKAIDDVIELISCSSEVSDALS